MMKKRTSMLAVLLSLALLLNLTACGKQGSDDAWDGGPVSIAQTLDYTSNLTRIADGCAVGESLYLLGAMEEMDASGQVRRETYQLLRVPLEGGAAETLPDYRSVVGSEEAERCFIRSASLRAGADGTLWLAEKTADQFFDLPEDFDEGAGNWLDYLTETRQIWTLCQVDQDGKELFRFQEEMTALEKRLGIGPVTDMVMDNDGEIVVQGETGAAVLNSAGEVRFTILLEPAPYGNYPYRLVLLNDGSVGMTDSSEEGGGFYVRLRLLNKEARDWGTRYLLPAESSVYDGSEEALFYYLAGDELRAWTAETEDAGKGEAVLNWADVGIDCKALHFIAPLDGGRAAAMTRDDWSEWAGLYLSSVAPEVDQTELFLVSSLDEPGERKVLTYATLGLWGNDRTAILEFNRTNPDYQIVVKDYTDYSPNASREDAIMRLATEIGAGKVPDLLVISDMPVVQWASAGLLEDLWPWIDQDPEIDREDLMEHVFEALEIGGKLYEVSDTFTMSTVFAPKDVVGDRLAWTPEDMEAALADMPEGCIGIDKGGTELLLNILNLDWGQFVDWEKGECSFDSDGFKSLLEFCGRFPESVPGHDWNRVHAGQQLVATIFANGFESVQVANAVVNGEAAFVGYPNPWGKAGSCFQINRTVAMCSACKYKEGAWEFMRKLLLPSLPEEQVNVHSNSFHTNKVDFQRAMENAMTSSLFHTSIYGDVEVSYHDVTGEERDQLMALYDAVDTVYRRDLSLETIISEVAGAYFAGDKSLDETASLIQNRASLYVNEQK